MKNVIYYVVFLWSSYEGHRERKKSMVFYYTNFNYTYKLFVFQVHLYAVPL